MAIKFIYYLMHFFFRAALILLNERDYRILIDAINVVMLFSDVAS